MDMPIPALGQYQQYAIVALFSGLLGGLALYRQAIPHLKVALRSPALWIYCILCAAFGILLLGFIKVSGGLLNLREQPCRIELLESAFSRLCSNNDPKFIALAEVVIAIIVQAVGFGTAFAAFAKSEARIAGFLGGAWQTVYGPIERSFDRHVSEELSDMQHRLARKITLPPEDRESFLSAVEDEVTSRIGKSDVDILKFKLLIRDLTIQVLRNPAMPQERFQSHVVLRLVRHLLSFWREDEIDSRIVGLTHYRATNPSVSQGAQDAR